MQNLWHRLWHHPLSACNVETKEHETSIRLVREFQWKTGLNKVDIPCSPRDSEDQCTQNRCKAIMALNRHLDKYYTSESLDKDDWAKHAVDTSNGPFHLDFDIMPSERRR